MSRFIVPTKEKIETFVQEIRPLVPEDHHEQFDTILDSVEWASPETLAFHGKRLSDFLKEVFVRGTTSSKKCIEHLYLLLSFEPEKKDHSTSRYIN